MAYSTRAIVLDVRGGSITVIDEERGKITLLTPDRTRVVRGALIEYLVDTWRDRLSIRYPDLLAFPALWVMEDLVFFHRVIDICSIFLPQGHGVPELYPFLTILYEPYRARSGCNFFKKLFIAKLLFCLHLYDEEGMDQELFSLISCSRDSMFEQQDDAMVEKHITQWLERSIMVQGLSDRLITFLRNPRM